MYENGKPFFKEWNEVVLWEGIIGYFDTSVRVFMEFVETVLNIRKVRHIRIVACTKSGVRGWFIAVGFVIYRLLRFVESCIKSCENLLHVEREYQ